MAKKPVAKPVKRRPPPRRKSGSGESNALGVLFLIGLITLGIVNRDAALLVALGLLPTFVLAFTTRGTHKAQRTLSVGFANSAGILVLIGDVWVNPNAFETMIVSLNTWIIMWGAAAIGYALNYVGPMIAAMILQAVSQERTKQINQQKQELVEQWGTDVLGSKEKDKPDLAGMSRRRPQR